MGFTGSPKHLALCSFSLVSSGIMSGHLPYFWLAIPSGHWSQCLLSTNNGQEVPCLCPTTIWKGKMNNLYEMLQLLKHFHIHNPLTDILDSTLRVSKWAKILSPQHLIWWMRNLRIKKSKSLAQGHVISQYTCPCYGGQDSELFHQCRSTFTRSWMLKLITNNHNNVTLDSRATLFPKRSQRGFIHPSPNYFLLT